LIDGRGLADSGLAGHEYNLPGARQRAMPRFMKPSEVIVASDKDRALATAGVWPTILIGTRVSKDNRRDEAIAATMGGFDKARGLRIVAERVAHFVDADGKSSV